MNIFVNLFLSSLPGIVFHVDSTPTEVGKKPDLMIESIAYEKKPNLHGPVHFDGLWLVFTLRIKNIGDTKFTHPLFISNTRSEREIEMGHYSRGQQAYYDQNLKSRSIAPGGVLEVKVEDILDRDVSRVKFLITTDGNPHLKELKVPKAPTIPHDKQIRMPPRVEESDYENNSYEIEIKHQ